MKKIALIALLALGVMLLIGVSYPKGATAGVKINVGINVPPPPPLLIPAPPPVFVIPGTYVYFAPEVDVDIFFYHGYWYRPHRGHWYRARSYNGKWVYISHKRVPPVLLNLPPNFRRVPPGHRHVPHRELNKNWRRWERERYWERHGGREWHGEKWRHNEGHDRGRGRHSD